MPVWTRGAESAEILAPFPQKLVVAALGNSGSTGPAGRHRRDRRLRQRRCASRRARRARCAARSSSSTIACRQPGRLGLRPVRRARAARARPSPARRARWRSSSARSAPTITATRTPACMSFADGADADPGRRAVGPRRRAARPHPQARQAGDDAADAGQPEHRQAPVGQCHRRSPGPRSQAAADPGRRPSRQLGPGHRRDRRWRRASPSPPPPPSGSWMPGGRCAPSASSGSAPRKSACSAGSTIAPSTARSRITRSPKAISAPTASGRSTASSARRARPRPRRSAAALAPLGIVTGSFDEADGSDIGPMLADGAARRRPQPGRHALFRPAPHARRHARQDRSRAAAPECRGLDRDARGAVGRDRSRKRAKRR